MMHVEQYRAKARFAQAAAESSRDEVMRSEWTRMAQGWLRLVDMADGQTSLAASLSASRAD